MTPERVERDATIVVRHGIAGPHRQRQIEIGDGFRVTAALVKRETVAAQHVRQIRLAQRW
jgi:hypothetical protein